MIYIDLPLSSRKNPVVHHAERWGVCLSSVKIAPSVKIMSQWGFYGASCNPQSRTCSDLLGSLDGAWRMNCSWFHTVTRNHQNKHHPNAGHSNSPLRRCIGQAVHSTWASEVSQLAEPTKSDGWMENFDDPPGTLNNQIFMVVSIGWFKTFTWEMVVSPNIHLKVGV